MLFTITPFDAEDAPTGRNKKSSEITLEAFIVRMKGLEPPRLSALDPKSSAATNYATSA